MNERMGAACCAPRIDGVARRQEIRIPVRLSGTIAVSGRPPVSAEICDLSRGGACCRVAAPPPIGSELDLRLDGLSAQALVCWTAGSRIGLRFLHPLRASDILIQSGRSRAAEGHDHPLHVRILPRRGRQTG